MIVIGHPGTVYERAGQKYELVAIQALIPNGFGRSYTEAGEVPSWVSDVIETRGKFVPPEGYMYEHFPGAGKARDCYTVLVFRKIE